MDDAERLRADWWGLMGKGLVPVGAERLRELALGVVRGEVFTSGQVREADRLTMLPMVFLPLALGGLRDWPEEELEKIGGLYGPMTSASPRSVNGYPCLFQMGVLGKEDWAKLWVRVQKMEAAMAAVGDD